MSLTWARVGANHLSGWLLPPLLLLSSLPAAASPGASALAIVAPSEADIEAAKRENQLGSDAYALGNYQEAVAHFEQAYALSHEPGLLFNLGQSYTRWYDISNDLEHLKKAKRLYENYALEIDGQDLDEAAREAAHVDADRGIAEVERRMQDHRESKGSEGDQGDDEARPLHRKAWFWLAIVGGAALIAGGVTTAVILTRRDAGFDPELGTIGGLGAGGARFGGGPGGLVFRF